MDPLKIKQNNIVAISCSISAYILGNTVKSAILDSAQNIKPLNVDIVDTNNFIVYLDTNGCAIGRAYLDIKIGNVSSENIIIIIEKSIS